MKNNRLLSGLNPGNLIGSVAGVTSCFMLISSCKAVKEKQQPNIIIFLADDLGYGDLACYANDGLHTAAIESIANQGVKFTSFYANGAESTPTRTALLTGRYQHRVGGLECAIGTDNVGRYDDAIRLRETHNLGLPVSETSIAQILKGGGYNTAMAGKWHLGYEEKFNPVRHGFDNAIYALGGEMDYFHHMEKPPISLQILYKNEKPFDNKEYFTDLIGEESLKFLDSQTRQKPFFLYVPFTAPHAPYQGPGDYRPEVLSDTSAMWNQSRGPAHIYHAMITSMDENIGRILEKLEEKELSDNTIVIFMSDNGGTSSGSNGILRGNKGNVFEGGIRVPCIVKWPGKIPEGKVSDQPCMTIDLSASIVRAAGATIPANRAFDGIDVLKLIEDNSPVEERTMFWRARRGENTRKAVRQGNMKYIWMINDGNIEEFLFDLGADISETRNLSESMPEAVTKMKILLESWEEEVKPVR